MLLKNEFENFVNCRFIGTDINETALELSRKTSQSSNCEEKIEFYLSYFADELEPQINKQVDILIFNPVIIIYIYIYI